VSAARKKVLFLIPSLVGGGAERVFTILLRHLDRQRFDPQLVVLDANGLQSADIPSDIVVHDLGAKRVRYGLPRLIRLIWTARPDTIVSTLGHLNIAISMFRRLLPSDVKVILREAILVSSLFPKESKNSRFWTWLYRHSYKRADAVVCLSDSMVEDMVANFGLAREKLVRIYNPVDVEKVRNDAAQQPNPYQGSGPFLVAAGRLTYQKGFDILLQAMPAVLAALPSAHLVILGEGELRQPLEAQARSLNLSDAVCFPGFQKNPWTYVKHANAFVLPSRFEGMPNAMMEALALGTPVIAANCPGAVAEIAAMTSNILMVPSDDPEALACAIIATCKNAPSESLSAQNGLGLFDLSRVVDEYSQTF
jgi:glycosyltransferase involved in cell wall biosynthesis